jgi:hypothetical protein
MNGQTTPTLPKPAKSTLRIIAPPPLKRKTVLAIVVSVITGLPKLSDMLLHADGLPIPTWLRNALAVVAVVSLWSAPILAQIESNDSSGRVAELPGNDGGVVPPQETN